MRVIELNWKCGECDTDGILGRHKRCPECGSPREKGEMNMDGLGSDDYAGGRNKAASVTDPELLKLANAGADWFCEACESGNMGAVIACKSCGAPRQGVARVWDPGEGPKRPPPLQAHSDREEESWYTWWTEAPKTSRAEDQPGRAYVFFGGLALSILVVIGIIWWAFSTHPVTGTVAEMTWNQSTIVQTWTQVTKRAWYHQTSQVSEIPPRGGGGERAGMYLLPGSCSREHYDNERYACGTDRVCTPKTRSESYTCGETCSDNGNGYATCRPKTCYRTVPDGETCRNETRYCTRAIYKDKCTYQTQEWLTTKTLVAAGQGEDTKWPAHAPGPLDRLRYTSAYSVAVAYEDDGPQRYVLEPNSLWFFSAGILTESEAKKAEREFKEWSIGESVALKVNNLGGVHEAAHAEAIP